MRESKKETQDRKVWLSQLGPVLKDLGLARKRIAKLGAARWLFEFAYSDLQSLSAGELTNYGFDILALVIPKDPKDIDNQELIEATMKVRLFTTPINEVLRILDEKVSGKISDDEATSAHKALSLIPPTVPIEWIV